MKFGTLGSAASNHALVLRRYLEARRIDGAETRLYDDFLPAFEELVNGDIDFVLQVSVHPQHAECVARYANRAFIADSFIAPSKPLGVLTRSEVTTPKSIALQPATRHYVELSGWETQIEAASITTVADGLLAGEYDSGLTAKELLEKHPGRFRLDLEIGAIQDAWVLFGREPVCREEILIWPESPVRRLLSNE